jgi:hypothetical protein
VKEVKAHMLPGTSQPTLSPRNCSDGHSSLPISLRTTNPLLLPKIPVGAPFYDSTCPGKLSLQTLERGEKVGKVDRREGLSENPKLLIGFLRPEIESEHSFNHILPFADWGSEWLSEPAWLA